jgi:hypothetical protein
MTATTTTTLQPWQPQPMPPPTNSNSNTNTNGYNGCNGNGTVWPLSTHNNELGGIAPRAHS